MLRNILIGLLFISTLGFGQSDFKEIDKNSRIVPDSLSDYTEIANTLTEGLTSDKEKARAIYIWISHNIKYDLSLINSSQRYNAEQEITDHVLKYRKGVCLHYAELFLAMSKSVGLKSYMISGYTRDGLGNIADLGHAWNGIQINSNFYLIDVTWASGYVDNGKYVHNFNDDYFLISPNNFIKDHMPFDPIWQFLKNPITNNEFLTKDFSKLETKGYFSYADSVEQHEKSDHITQLKNSNRRIVDSGVKNNMIQMQVDENILQITNLKYNLAIDTLNYGITNYNLYITHRNRKFLNPKLDDSYIKELIDNAGKGIYAANNIFNELVSSNRELNKLINDARKKMPALISDVEREKDFTVRYLKKWKLLRKFMFLTYI